MPLNIFVGNNCQVKGAAVRDWGEVGKKWIAGETAGCDILSIVCLFFLVFFARGV